MFIVVFPAFHNLYTPPKTPSFPTGPASLLVVLRGFPPHFIDTRAQNRVFCSDFDGFSLEKSMRPCSLHLPFHFLRNC